MWQSPVGVKNTITQSTYFLNGPTFNLLFYCNIISYWEKVTSYEKFSQNLTLEEVSKCWKIVEFTKISVKMKNCKTFYKAQKSSRLNKIIQLLPNPLHQINLATSFLTEIYRNKRTFAFKVLQECSFVRQETVKCKCFFLTPKKNMFAGKCLVNSETFLVVLQQHIISNVKWVEVYIMSEIFLTKLYCKMNGLFR